MAKELYLYNSIHQYSAEQFIRAMEDAKGQDIVVRVNCNGGAPEDGWGMIAKFIDHEGTKQVKVDGKAYSWGAYFLCFTEDTEALDVSEFIIHRAAYPSWFEKSESMTAERWAELDKVNGKLRKALEAKVDVEKFEKITGVKMDDVFSNKMRIDVPLSSEQAKKIGLIKSIKKITPEKRAEIDSLSVRIAAESNGISDQSKSNKNKIMDLNTLKAEHPALYNQIFAEGKKAGAQDENDRIGAWMAFADADIEAVKKGIESGKAPSVKEMAELTRKAFSAEALKTIEKDSQGEVNTGEAEGKEKTEKEKSIEAFLSEVKAELKK